MPFLPSLRKGASLLDLFKAFPETSIPLIQFHEALLRRPSPFTEGERELIAALRVRIELPLLSRCPQRDGGAPGHQARIGG